MSVLPAASAKSAGIPGCLRALMTDKDSPLISYYPESFEIGASFPVRHAVCPLSPMMTTFSMPDGPSSHTLGTLK
jgi:hypothetical protein